MPCHWWKFVRSLSYADDIPKMNAKFAEDFRGSNGEGPFCYSINASDPGNNPAAYADLAVKCVADEAAMTSQGDHDFSSKQFTSFRSGNSYSNAKTAANGDEVYVFSDMDTIATVEESIRMIVAGCELVRITAPSKKEALNLKNIKKELAKIGYNTCLLYTSPSPRDRG